MKKIGKYLFFILLSLFVKVTNVYAEINLKTDLSSDEVILGENLQLTLSINSNSDFNNEDPDLPVNSDFKIVQAENSGRSSSSRMNIVNGKTEFSKTVTQRYDFVLQFLKKGLMTIPSISVNVNGIIQATAPLKIQVLGVNESKNSQQNVVRNNIKGQRPKAIQNDPFDVDDDMFSQLLKQRQKILEDAQNHMNGQNQNNNDQIPNLKLDVNNNESFFVYADVNKSTAYEGEQVTTNWYIYVKGNIDTLDRAKFPDLKGFWKEIIEEVPTLQFSSAIVNGISYKRALLASHALFPIKAGVSVIDEFKIKATVRNLTQFGWGKPNEFTKSSKRLNIQVLPLPSEGKPLSFSGAVGQFQISPSLENYQVKAGQPFSLKIRFEGQGNAKVIELPPINWPENLVVFDTKSESKFFKNGQSFKEFEILLIQNQEGSFKIPQIVFTYFDPELKKYVTKNTEELQLMASKSDTAAVRLSKKSSTDQSVAAYSELTPILEWPGSFSWLAYRDLFFVIITSVGLLILSAQFLKSYIKINVKPTLSNIINKKNKQIEVARIKKDFKSVGTESVHLIYILLDHLNSNQPQQQNISDKLSELPLKYKEKYEKRLTEIFQYFQTVGFAPEEVKVQLMNQKNIDQELTDLKNITTEISQDFERST